MVQPIGKRLNRRVSTVQNSSEIQGIPFCSYAFGRNVNTNVEMKPLKYLYRGVSL